MPIVTLNVGKGEATGKLQSLRLFSTLPRTFHSHGGVRVRLWNSMFLLELAQIFPSTGTQPYLRSPFDFANARCFISQMTRPNTLRRPLVVWILVRCHG